MLDYLRNKLAEAQAAIANRIRTQDGPGPWRPKE